MVKPVSTNKVREFLIKHRKVVIIYNVLIYLILLCVMLVYNAETTNYVSRADMELQIKEKCSNEVEIPTVAYNVRFNHDSNLNVTICEVIIK